VPGTLGQRVAALAAGPAGLEPALLAEAGHEDPDDVLADPERAEELNQGPQADLAAVVADVLAEQVEDDRALLHASKSIRSGWV
jgi:hypothetical protein